MASSRPWHHGPAGWDTESPSHSNGWEYLHNSGHLPQARAARPALLPFCYNDLEISLLSLLKSNPFPSLPVSGLASWGVNAQMIVVAFSLAPKSVLSLGANVSGYPWAPFARWRGAPWGDAPRGLGCGRAPGDHSEQWLLRSVALIMFCTIYAFAMQLDVFEATPVPTRLAQ